MRPPASDVLNNDLNAFTRPRRGRDTNDRLIPMINVVFLLLTFFMIAGTIRVADSIDIDPPETKAAGTLDSRDLLLYVGRDGALALGAERLNEAAAFARIAETLSQNNEAGLQLKADRHVKASVILPILKKLSDLGLKRLELVAVKRAEGR